MGLIDKAIAVIAPRYALHRMQARMAMDTAARHARKYDGASAGRRTAGWKGAATSANAEIAPAVMRLRNHAREAERNNAWASKAGQALIANTIGTGIRAQPHHRSKAKKKRAADLWRDWAETTACDFDGTMDLYGLQALAFGAAVRDGEALIRFRRVLGGPVPMKLQVLEADFLDTSRSTAPGGARIEQGCELDAEGRIVAYWLWTEHPGDSGGWFWQRSKGRSERVPAEQIARVYRRDRPGQIRGVTWYAPVLLPLNDLEDYEDAQLIRQKIAACFAVFITDSTGTEGFGAPSGADDLPERLEPGIIEELPAGRSVEAHSPPVVEGYEAYVRAVLRKIAAGLGMTYESLTGDLSQTNFSGGRMSWIQEHRNIEAWRWRMFIPQFCGPVWAEFRRAASIAGADISDVSAEWTPPRRELISPKEEIAAMISEVRAGFGSWSEMVRSRGYDPDVLIEEIAADLARFKSMGLVLDVDPSMTTQAGQRQKAEQANGAKPEAAPGAVK